MEIGKHLNKGMWGLGAKALPVVYGFGYVLLVIRVLPEEEFGNFVLVQEVFLVISGFATAFALQPLMKFSSEENADLTGIVSASLVLNAGFTLAASLLVVVLSPAAGSLLNSPSLPPLLNYVPALLGASLARNFTSTLLQARFRIREVFWMDAVHFLGAPLLVWITSRMHLFNEALDLVLINVVSLSASSVLGIWYVRGMAQFRLRARRDEFSRIWNYGKFSFGGTVSSLFSTKADSFILSAFTGPVQVAVYNSAKVFVRLFEMASQVVQMFLLPVASRLSSQGDASSLKAITEKSILFLTIGLLPVTALFLFLPEFLVGVVYEGRYTDAVPLLRIFSFLTLVVPVTAVGSNVLMGLGHARLGFILGLETLIASLAVFMLCIPPWGPVGASLGYVVAAIVTAAITAHALNRFVPVTPHEILAHSEDIKAFLKNRM